MLLKSETPIDGKTAGELTEELADTGAALMVQYLASPTEYPPETQDDTLGTYAKKIEKQDARLDFSQPAEQVERQIRAYNPVPGAFFEYQGNRYRILKASVGKGSGSAGTILDDQLLIGCGAGTLQPEVIQKAGKPAMDLKSFLNGTKIPAGTVLQ
jgi:methionyl-tRNA formyltransferase